MAVPWAEMELSLQKWVQTNNHAIPIWDAADVDKPTSVARALRLRLEGSLSGYVSILNFSLFVYKSSLKEALTNFCAEGY